MLNSHGFSSLNLYQGIPFPCIIINFFAYFFVKEKYREQNKRSCPDMPAMCPEKYTLVDFSFLGNNK